MLRRFLVFIVLTVVLFVLANTVAHANTHAHHSQHLDIRLEKKHISFKPDAYTILVQEYTSRM